MERVYVFLIRNDVWIYIICGLGLLWYLNELIRSHSALQRAMFGLERETALRTRNTALMFVVFFSAIAGAVIYVNTEIRPSLPPDALNPPTPSINVTFGVTVPANDSTPDVTVAPSTPTSPIAPTVTLSGAPLTDTVTTSITGTITTTVPVTEETGLPTQIQATEPPLLREEPAVGTQVSGCTPSAIISEPREGATVLGLLNVFGTANTSDFGFYEIEIRGPQTNDRWASLVGRRINQPVVDGILAGNVNLSPWAAGTYDVRLTISDTNEQITHQCSVSISLRTSAQE